jgi:hypothetical protein
VAERLRQQLLGGPRARRPSPVRMFGQLAGRCPDTSPSALCYLSRTVGWPPPTVRPAACAANAARSDLCDAATDFLAPPCCRMGGPPGLSCDLTTLPFDRRTRPSRSTLGTSGTDLASRRRLEAHLRPRWQFFLDESGEQAQLAVASPDRRPQADGDGLHHLLGRSRAGAPRDDVGRRELTSDFWVWHALTRDVE